MVERVALEPPFWIIFLCLRWLIAFNGYWWKWRVLKVQKIISDAKYHRTNTQLWQPLSRSMGVVILALLKITNGPLVLKRKNQRLSTPKLTLRTQWNSQAVEEGNVACPCPFHVVFSELGISFVNFFFKQLDITPLTRRPYREPRSQHFRREAHYSLKNHRRSPDFKSFFPFLPDISEPTK